MRCTHTRNFNPTIRLNIAKGCSKVSPACKNCFIGVFDDIIFYDNWKDKVENCNEFGANFLTSLSTDLFYEKLDCLRDDYWKLVRDHPNFIFTIITKRVERIVECLPDDWGEGYDNVLINVTIENQKMADERIPIFEKIPCKHKGLTITPMLEKMDIEKYLSRYHYDIIECGGEEYFCILGTMDVIRPLYFDWVKDVCDQAKRTNTRFLFLHPGSKFIDKDGNLIIDMAARHYFEICETFGLNYYQPIEFTLKDGKIIK